MARYVPIVLGVLAIVGLTIPQVVMSDRFAGSNVSAEQRGKLLDNIPMRIGDWQGENLEIDPTVRQTAGAVGAVSRVYRNSRTGDKVDLWLIVGHGRPVAAHTPNICYQTSGFEVRAAENSLYPMVFPNMPQEAPFWTNTFFKEDVTGRRLIRVFWSWYNPENSDHDGKVVWEAPPNSRWHFGNTRALYKMYFTSEMKDHMETADQSACLRFAREFMPIVNEALAEVHLNASGEPTAKIEDAAVADSTSDAGQSETSETPAEPEANQTQAEPPVDEAPVDPTGLFSDPPATPGESTPGDAATAQP
jgi:hypothetical protein